MFFIDSTDLENISFEHPNIIYKNLNREFYSIESINYNSFGTQVVIVQRHTGALIEFLLGKEREGWKIMNKYKVQGNLKGSDFLYSSIVKQIHAQENKKD